MPIASADPVSTTMASVTERATALKAEGNKFFSAKEYHEAIAKYSDAIELEPNAILHANRAQCHLMLKQFVFPRG